MEMMFEVAIGVMDMEDDKVADMVLRIPNEDFTDGTVVGLAMRIDAHHLHIVQKNSHFLPINCHFGSGFPNPWAQSPCYQYKLG